MLTRLPARCAGPSGSGKTTLLNSLACRLDKGTKMSGELRLNGKKYTLHDLKMNAGYGAPRLRRWVTRGACSRAPCFASQSCRTTC